MYDITFNDYAFSFPFTSFEHHFYRVLNLAPSMIFPLLKSYQSFSTFMHFPSNKTLSYSVLFYIPSYLWSFLVIITWWPLGHHSLSSDHYLSLLNIFVTALWFSICFPNLPMIFITAGWMIISRCIRRSCALDQRNYKRQSVLCSKKWRVMLILWIDEFHCASLILYYYFLP